MHSVARVAPRVCMCMSSVARVPSRVRLPLLLLVCRCVVVMVLIHAAGDEMKEEHTFFELFEVAAAGVCQAENFRRVPCVEYWKWCSSDCIIIHAFIYSFLFAVGSRTLIFVIRSLYYHNIDTLSYIMFAGGK